MKATIVNNSLGLIVVDIGMTAQLLERETIDVKLLRMRMGDHKILLGRRGEVGNLVKLVDTDISTQPLAVSDNLFGKIGSNAWHSFQLGGIGSIEHDMLTFAQLMGIAQRITWSGLGSYQRRSGLIVGRYLDVGLQASLVFYG